MNETKQAGHDAVAGPVEPSVGRHCWNAWCDGPEWWALFDDAQDEYRDCPSCGYPCKIERVPDSALTVDAICNAVYVTPNVEVTGKPPCGASGAR